MLERAAPAGGQDVRAPCALSEQTSSGSIVLASAPWLGLQCRHQHRLPGIARRLPFFYSVLFLEVNCARLLFLGKAQTRVDQ